MGEGAATYWYSRFLFERALSLAYLVAFLVAVNQFVPLLGQNGLEPATRFVQYVPFRASPSLFYLAASDRAFRLAAWAGVALSVLAFTSYAAHVGTLASAAIWAGLWLLYLSFVNVGQTFYGFGWETLLLEAGFLTIFAGGSATVPGRILILLYRWLLFRVMFGAGLIKLRGDPCWRDLTCLDYYFETQPMPNPLSWYFHWLPYLSWLNWLTIVLAIPTLDDRWLSWLPVRAPALHDDLVWRMAIYGLAVIVGVLSIAPTLNMLSPRQVMNTSFEPLHSQHVRGVRQHYARAERDRARRNGRRKPLRYIDLAGIRVQRQAGRIENVSAFTSARSCCVHVDALGRTATYHRRSGGTDSSAALPRPVASSGRMPMRT
jgi:hypothetical protein